MGLFRNDKCGCKFGSKEERIVVTVRVCLPSIKPGIPSRVSWIFADHAYSVRTKCALLAWVLVKKLTDIYKIICRTF